MVTTRLYVGTSGWSYAAWRDGFYRGVPRRCWLTHCACHFTGIEVNATFYRMPSAAVVGRWRDATPPGFGIAIKGSRLVSHLRRLVGVADAVTLLRDAVTPLGDRLIAVLWQLPPGLVRDLILLEQFADDLDRTWPDVRHAIEFRHPSWFEPRTAALLTAHRLANCLSDSPRWPMWRAITTDLVYLRFHGHRRLYASAYGRAALRSWARRLRFWLDEGRTVHAYFDNDAEGAAPNDAMTLLDLARRLTRRKTGLIR